MQQGAAQDKLELANNQDLSDDERMYLETRSELADLLLSSGSFMIADDSDEGDTDG